MHINEIGYDCRRETMVGYCSNCNKATDISVVHVVSDDTEEACIYRCGQRLLYHAMPDRHWKCKECHMTSDDPIYEHPLC